jgi:transposase
MHPPKKPHVFSNFSSKIMLKHFITTPPPPAPDLSPPYYFQFPKLKIKLKGPRFADVAEIQEAVTNELRKVQKEEFSAVFQEL